MLRVFNFEVLLYAERLMKNYMYIADSILGTNPTMH